MFQASKTDMGLSGPIMPGQGGQSNGAPDIGLLTSPPRFDTGVEDSVRYCERDGGSAVRTFWMFVTLLLLGGIGYMIFTVMPDVIPINLPF